MAASRQSTPLGDLSGSEILELPIDHLALVVLRHFKATNEWNTLNFRNTQKQNRQNFLVESALTEAVGWLHANNLLAHGKPGPSHGEAVIITRAGEQALQDDLASARAYGRLSVDAHPRLRRVQSQFLIGEFELAAFAAMRAVEIRVRELAGADDSLLGVKLMREAFGKTGPLTDGALDGGEQTGVMELFAGAIGTFKNPPSHRQVDYGDATEASEVVLLADLLLRLLDRTAERIARQQSKVKRRPNRVRPGVGP